VSKNAETTGENPPANFMFAAVKGLTANIHNQGDVKENKDESSLKEEYPEDFNA